MAMGFLGTRGERGRVAVGSGMPVEGTPFGGALDDLVGWGFGGGQPGFTGFFCEGLSCTIISS